VHAPFNDMIPKVINAARASRLASYARDSPNAPELVLIEFGTEGNCRRAGPRANLLA